MKMPGPRGVITGTASFKVAYAYKRASSERIPTLVGSQRAVTPSATDTIVVGLDTTVPMEQGGGPKTTPSTINVCNAPNFAVEFFFLFFTRQNSGVTFSFSFSPR
jgi:hypothetical protein